MGSDGHAARQQPTLEERLATIHAELTKVETERWLLALGTPTLYVYLTYLGLRHRLAEGNPIMSAAMETMGFAALGLSRSSSSALRDSTANCGPNTARSSHWVS